MVVTPTVFRDYMSIGYAFAGIPPVLFSLVFRPLWVTFAAQVLLLVLLWGAATLAIQHSITTEHQKALVDQHREVVKKVPVWSSVAHLILLAGWEIVTRLWS